MITLKSYKFRLKPTDEQVAMLKQHGGNVRCVWNKLLEYSLKNKEKYNRYPSQSEYQKKIIELKSEHEFLKLTYSQPIQINAQRLAKTYVRAFSQKTVKERNKKIALAHQVVDPIKKEKAMAKALNFGFPKFKSKNDHSDSIFYPQNFIIQNDRIWFPKIGWIKYIKHRRIEGLPQFLTIVMDGTQYYVAITSEMELIQKPKVDLEHANIVGIDVGMKVFATLSDGTEIKNPRILKKYLRKIKKENRNLARKKLVETGEKTFYGKIVKKSSHNRDKQVIKLQTVHRKVRNVRNDFLHKTTHYIITKYDGVALETLDIQKLLQKNSKAMNRSMLDVSWYKWIEMLKYKSMWENKYFVQTGLFFPGTKKCSKCGGMSNLSLKDRVYICPHCGAVMDRDLNGSKNTLNEGIRLLREELNNNTVATTGIQACGSTSLKEVGMKQEKLGWQEFKRNLVQPQASAFRRG